MPTLPAFFDRKVFKKSVQGKLYTFLCETMVIMYTVLENILFFEHHRLSMVYKTIAMSVANSQGIQYNTRKPHIAWNCVESAFKTKIWTNFQFFKDIICNFELLKDYLNFLRNPLLKFKISTKLCHFPSTYFIFQNNNQLEKKKLKNNLMKSSKFYH